jgi:hypothetical protein
MNTAGNSAVTWSPNFEVYNNTYIVWGTEGIFGSYIVVSANESQRIEEIDIENGAGFEAIVILLNKGLDVDITVIDDTSIAPPVIANNPFVLVTPYGTVPMLLVGNKADQARKREGQRVFTFKSFNSISGLH